MLLCRPRNEHDFVGLTYSEMSTSEIFRGVRIHYIFRSLFVKCLDEVDPCEDLTDDDMLTTIHNATGPRFALFFVPDVPFNVLIRRQISRLSDRSMHKICLSQVNQEELSMYGT
ncbi:putative dynamin central domain, Dynamin superfamily [Helianthus anomalus]